jgi:hypothetical protein
MKIYNTKLFLGRLFVCGLIGTWIYYTEKMLWMIAHMGVEPGKEIFAMIMLQVFWGIGIFGSYWFFKEFVNVFKMFFKWAVVNTEDAIS